MNKISEICIANIVSWLVSQAVYRNTNRIVTKCIVTPLLMTSSWCWWQHIWFIHVTIYNEFSSQLSTIYLMSVIICLGGHGWLSMEMRELHEAPTTSSLHFTHTVILPWESKPTDNKETNGLPTSQPSSVANELSLFKIRYDKLYFVSVLRMNKTTLAVRKHKLFSNNMFGGLDMMCLLHICSWNTVYIVTVKSAWWLQMAWCLCGTRASAVIMMA